MCLSNASLPRAWNRACDLPLNVIRQARQNQLWSLLLKPSMNLSIVSLFCVMSDLDDCMLRRRTNYYPDLCNIARDAFYAAYPVSAPMRRPSGQGSRTERSGRRRLAGAQRPALGGPTWARALDPNVRRASPQATQHATPAQNRMRNAQPAAVGAHSDQPQ